MGLAENGTCKAKRKTGLSHFWNGPAIINLVDSFGPSLKKALASKGPGPDFLGEMPFSSGRLAQLFLDLMLTFAELVLYKKSWSLCQNLCGTGIGVTNLNL